MLEPDERVAYVYFRNFDEAREARHSDIHGSKAKKFKSYQYIEGFYEHFKFYVQCNFRLEYGKITIVGGVRYNFFTSYL